MKATPDFRGKDRKYKLALYSVLLMTLVGALGMKFEGVAALYSEFIAGVIGINIAFNGGNVGAKWAFGKAISGQRQTKVTKENKE